MTPPPLLTTPAVAFAAEQQFSREREEAVVTVWEEPEEAPRQADAAEIPAEVLALLADLDEIERRGEPAELSGVVPRASEGESFLRASLLTLLSGSDVGEGVAARLGALPLRVECEGDGWPEPIASGPIRRLTPGRIRPVAEGDEAAWKQQD
jgi:hypothetical protein